MSGPTKTLYISRRNAVDGLDEITGRRDLITQAEQVCRNLEKALAAGGTRLGHVVKWTVYQVERQRLEPGFAAFQQA